MYQIAIYIPSGEIKTALSPHYCFLTAFPLFLHPLNSLISNCLNMHFVAQGRSRKACRDLLSFFFFFLIYFFILAVLGLRFCARAFSSCGKRGPLFIAVRGPLTIAASPVAEHGPQTHRLSSRGSRAQPLRGMWDPPRPGLEPASPASAGRLPTTAPPGKPPYLVLILPFL